MIYPILNRRERRLRSGLRNMLQFESLETRAVLTATLLVPTIDYPSIQSAVDAASPGDKIRVMPGEYTESVTINKNNLEIKASHHLGTTVKPVSLGSFVFLVDGAQNVKIEGFKVSGPFDTTASTGFAGIEVNNGSAKIKDNLITMIRNNPLLGNQEGIGILVHQDNVPGTTKAEIEDNVISDYQKGGIVVSVGLGVVPIGSIVPGANAYAEIEDNVITGVGPTTVIGQNGIQISDKASAKIEDNRISGNFYINDAAVAGILITDDAGPTEVSDNKVFGNEIGIWVIDTKNVEVEKNDVYNNGDGIFVDNSSDVEVSKNDVFNNDFYGISLDGSTDVEISQNDVFGNGLNGISLFSSSSIQVSKNDVSRNGIEATSDEDGAGILLVGSTNNKISENEVERNASYGLYLDSASIGNLITKNEFERNVDGAILDLSLSGANTYRRNRFK